MAVGEYHLGTLLLCRVSLSESSLLNLTLIYLRPVKPLQG